MHGLKIGAEETKGREPPVVRLAEVDEPLSRSLQELRQASQNRVGEYHSSFVCPSYVDGKFVGATQAGRSWECYLPSSSRVGSY